MQLMIEGNEAIVSREQNRRDQQTPPQGSDKHKQPLPPCAGVPESDQYERQSAQQRQAGTEAHADEVRPERQRRIVPHEPPTGMALNRP